MRKYVDQFGNLVLEDENGTEFHFYKSPSFFGTGLVIGGIAIPDSEESNGYRNSGFHLPVGENLQKFLEENIPLEVVEVVFDFLIESVESKISSEYAIANT